jgi:uncharacterized protein YggE
MKISAAVLLVGVIATNGNASNLPEFPFVYAQGEANVEVAPDIATVSFHVEDYAEDATKAESVVWNRSKEILDFFNEFGISKKEIVAYQIDKNTVRESKEYNDLEIIGYEISRQIEITLLDLSIYEAILKKLVELPNITGIETEFERSDRDRIDKELISKACKDAEQKATLMAEGFGAKLGSVFAISRTEFENVAAQFGVAFSYGGIQEYSLRGVNEEEVLFVPSAVEFSIGVNVIFRLKEN